MHVKQMDSLNTKQQWLLRFSSIKYKETSITACRNWCIVSPLEFKIEYKPCTGYYHKFLCWRLQTHSRVFHSANIEQQKQALSNKNKHPRTNDCHLHRRSQQASNQTTTTSLQASPSPTQASNTKTDTDLVNISYMFDNNNDAMT